MTNRGNHGLHAAVPAVPAHSVWLSRLGPALANGVNTRKLKMMAILITWFRRSCRLYVVIFFLGVFSLLSLKPIMLGGLAAAQVSVYCACLLILSNAINHQRQKL